MDDPARHGLFFKAISEGLTGCFEWDDQASRNLRDNRAMDGLTATFIRRKVIEYVRAKGRSVIVQVKETRNDYKAEHDHWYKVILPMPDFKHGVFVEM